MKSLISFAVDNLTEFLTNAAVLCMAVFLLSSIGFKWTIIFLLIAFLHYFFYKFLEKNLFERSTAVRETESQYFNDFSENFLYIYSIKLQSLFDDYITKFQNAFDKYFVAVLRETKINFWFMTSNLNANEIFKILIFLLGGIDVLNGEMSVGNFVALNGYYSVDNKSKYVFQELRIRLKHFKVYRNFKRRSNIIFWLCKLFPTS